MRGVGPQEEALFKYHLYGKKYFIEYESIHLIHFNLGDTTIWRMNVLTKIRRKKPRRCREMIAARVGSIIVRREKITRPNGWLSKNKEGTRKVSCY